MDYYIPRNEMPQIDGKDLPALVATCVQYGHHVAFDVVEPGSLRAHQRVNHSRALGMPYPVAMKPLLVSSDNFVLDGNHRAYYHKIHGTMCNAIRIGLSFEEALPWLFSLPFTYRYTTTTPERN